ncbi:MAG: hypothetical protein RMM53_06980, partial [Bacteroidia bacterium]|nr:hypothetical protein [Bacteroidia bacterium]
MALPPQAYDAFFKDGLPEVAPTLLSLIENRRIVSVVERKTDLSHAVLNRRLDFVLEALDEYGRSQLIQIEEETGNDAQLADKLLGQLIAAKAVFGRYPKQYVGFLKPSAHRYRRGLDVKDPDGNTVARLYIHPFNFADLPARPFLELQTPKAFSFALFCNLAGVSETELRQRFSELLTRLSEKEKDVVAIGATLALHKSYIRPDFYHYVMQ